MAAAIQASNIKTSSSKVAQLEQLAQGSPYFFPQRRVVMFIWTMIGPLGGTSFIMSGVDSWKSHRVSFCAHSIAILGSSGILPVSCRPFQELISY